MNTVCWWLGEFLNLIHLPYVVAVMILGCLWIRPRWLWAAHNVLVVCLQIYFLNCPLVVAEVWLKGEGPHPGGWIVSIAQTYGGAGILVSMVVLSAVGVLIGLLLRKLLGPKPR